MERSVRSVGKVNKCVADVGDTACSVHTALRKQSGDSHPVLTPWGIAVPRTRQPGQPVKTTTCGSPALFEFEFEFEFEIETEPLFRHSFNLQAAEEGVRDPWVRHGDLLALQTRVLRLGKPPRRCGKVWTVRAVGVRKCGMGAERVRLAWGCRPGS